MRTRFILPLLPLALPVWAVAAEAADDAPSIWDRFQRVLADVSGELLTLVGQVMGWSVGFALLGLMMSLSGGFFLWRAMRDNKWLDGRWAWCKKIYWVWAGILVGMLGVGGCSTGMVWGAGTGAKRWVRQGEIFEKTVGHSYTALMIFRADARIGGKRPDALLEKDIAMLVRATRGIQDKAPQFEGQFREQLGQWLDSQKIFKLSWNPNTWYSGTKRFIMERAANFLWDQHVNNPLNDEDAEALVRDVLQADRNEADRKVARDVMSKVANSFRYAVIETIDKTVLPILFITVLLPLSLAFGPLCIYWLVGWLSGLRD